MDYTNRSSVPVAISPDSVVSRFFTRVYGWMAGGLALTALVAWTVASSPELLSVIVGNKIVFYGLMFAELGLVVWLSGMIGKMSPTTAAGAFLVYSALNGATLSVILLLYTGGSVASAFAVTAGTFAGMSIYGMTTKRALDGLGSFCFMGLIGVVIASLVNLFLKSTMLEFVLSCVSVVVFVGLTAWDTKKLKTMAYGLDPDSAEAKTGAIRGALALYLDFINLFLALLRLFGKRR